MEISLRMSPKIATVVLVPKLQKTRSSRRKAYHEFNNISCRSNEVAMQKRDITNFYEVLSLGSDHRNVSFDEIKKAYRNLALQCHPDVCPVPSAKQESTKRFVELRKAYETLSDPISRQMYDYELALVKTITWSEIGGVSAEENRNYSSRFSKEVWEKQLSGLKKRSQIRMEIRTKKYAGHEM
ncbi:chaperone protein dnaJ 20, chloroplastic-like [Juglans microcarpa x Juglans regia]|uniref:chaperone protein dnaJ 20, chloroplastic-like n=1 Tax=Juglans microcarpa x Juglans regia TaxID=2249226 RepID=UPI001B7F3C6E|nr:chaperone protein dnaJ 20, chloroplastic-like [Juglans microcarpa x Juglans regia]